MFNNILKYIIIIFFFLCNTILLAQDCSISIQGRVVDEVSQLPLSYVNVYLQETSQGAATDNDGRFFFKMYVLVIITLFFPISAVKILSYI